MATIKSKNIKNTKQQLQFYVRISFIIYPIFLFIGCHVAKCDIQTFADFYMIPNHIAASPLAILPIEGKTIFVTTYVYFIIIALLYVEYLRNKRLRTTDEQGSAAWNTDYQTFYKTFTDCTQKVVKIPFEKSKNVVLKFINKFIKTIIHLFGMDKVVINTKPGNNNMILSENVALDMNSYKTQRNNNILITGGSGSGKTRFEVKPNLLQANCSYVITDPSGEILETMGKFLEQQGYEIKVFNLVQTQFSHHYNPFGYIRDEEGVLSMITALIQNTTPPGSSSNDPFWEKAETALLQAICFYLYFECNMEDRNFTNVMKLINCAEVKEDQENYVSVLDTMMEEVKKRNPEHIAVLQYAVFKQASGKTAKSILVSAAVRLTVFNLKSIHKLTGDDNIDLASIGDKKTALFCITPVADSKFNFLVALLYTQLFETLYFRAETEYEGKRLPVSIRFMLDEFANIGTIPEFEKKLATMRKYGISCTIIIQNMAQLKTMYKDNWESITGNCDTFIFLGGQEQSTLEYLSKELGKETIVTQTDSRTFGQRKDSTRNRQIIARSLMEPDEIMRMNTKECIVRIRGIRPFYDLKYDYPKHPNYKYTGDANKDNLYVIKNELSETMIRKKELDKVLQKRQMHSSYIQSARNINRPIPDHKSIKGVKHNVVRDVDESVVKDMMQSIDLKDIVKNMAYYESHTNNKEDENVEKPGDLQYPFDNNDEEDEDVYEEYIIDDYDFVYDEIEDDEFLESIIYTKD